MSAMLEAELRNDLLMSAANSSRSPQRQRVALARMSDQVGHAA
jgi:hypothetical protein